MGDDERRAKSQGGVSQVESRYAPEQDKIKDASQKKAVCKVPQHAAPNQADTGRQKTGSSPVLFPQVNREVDYQAG